MARTALAFAIAATALVTGCASQIRVTYQSDPPGATIYQNSQPMGVTPVTLTYAPDPAFDKGQCVRLEGPSVKWASGATASVSFLNACPAQGYNQVYSFARPDVPGREADMRYALELQRNSILSRQAQAQQDAATAQIINATNLPRPPATINSPRPPPTNCTSTVLGNTIRTNCY
jgi:hypothetical protein